MNNDALQGEGVVMHGVGVLPARFNYGLRERQMRRLVAEAKRSSGVTGDRVLEFLERRLDNTVFRAGFAATIPAARQQEPIS